MSPIGSLRLTFIWHFCGAILFSLKKKKNNNNLPVFKKQIFTLKSEFLASLEKKIRQSDNAGFLFLGGSRWLELNGWDGSFPPQSPGLG